MNTGTTIPTEFKLYQATTNIKNETNIDLGNHYDFENCLFLWKGQSEKYTSPRSPGNNGGEVIFISDSPFPLYSVLYKYEGDSHGFFYDYDEKGKLVAM